MLDGDDRMKLDENVVKQISDFCYNMRDCGYCAFNQEDGCKLYSEEHGIPEKWRGIIDGKERKE